MKTLLISMLLFLPGCASRVLHFGEDATLRQCGSPTVGATRAQIKLKFDVDKRWRETIQDQNWNTLPWVTVESHKQKMWIPDYQIIVVPDDGEEHYRSRHNTVYPGRTEGAPWNTPPGVFKGVCLISGWLDGQGRPMANGTYFRWGGRQGGQVVERYGEGLTYLLEFWTAGHVDNPRPGAACLRLTTPGDIYYWLDE